MGGGLWNTFGELGVGALVATQKGRRAGCQPRRPWTWGQTVQSERLLLPETPETLSNSKGALLWPFGAKAESSEDSPSFLLGQGCGEWAQNRGREHWPWSQAASPDGLTSSPGCLGQAIHLSVSLSFLIRLTRGFDDMNGSHR